MAFWIGSLGGLAVAYLLGATPTGFLAGRLIRGIDIREHGSGSTGATNVLRTLGKWPALAVIVIDAAKGAAAIVFARLFFPWLYAATPPGGMDLKTLLPWLVCLCGLAALIGHARSVWLRFTGGKSAATGVGVLLALSWPVGLGAWTVFVAVVATLRIVSLGSMLAAMTAVVLVFALDEPTAYRLLVVVGSAYVIVRHRANIGRLLAGVEPRIGQGGGATP
jgi:glycerol-3-phosphate acyltransferase PlsY